LIIEFTTHYHNTKKTKSKEIFSKKCFNILFFRKIQLETRQIVASVGKKMPHETIGTLRDRFAGQV